MKKIRWAGIALATALGLTGLSCYYDQDFATAQAATDRETVDCLTHQLMRDEKSHIARLTALHDNDDMCPVYTEALSRCIVRADQWDRHAQFVANARQMLSHDPEFRQMLGADAFELAQSR